METTSDSVGCMSDHIMHAGQCHQYNYAHVTVPYVYAYGTVPYAYGTVPYAYGTIDFLEYL